MHQKEYLDASRYLAGLFALAHDPSSEVRKPVCTGLVQLLHLQPERLVPHMQDIIEYMLESTQVNTSRHLSHWLQVRTILLLSSLQAPRMSAGICTTVTFPIDGTVSPSDECSVVYPMSR